MDFILSLLKFTIWNKKSNVANDDTDVTAEVE